jgi:RNA polymerase sigma-70 factor (ECF subfamily)
MPIFLYPMQEIRVNQCVMQRPTAQAGTPASARGGDNRAGEATFEDLLVAVGRARSRDAFIRLFEHYAPRIKSFLIKGGAPPEVADELAQETMLSLWQRADSFDPAKSAAGTWIYAIARNKRIDALRRHAARGGRHVPVDELFFIPDETAAAPDDALAAAEETRTVAAAMAALPPEQAELLYKSFFENKSHSEIAAENGLPLGTVKSRIRLALDRLRGRIRAEDML